jgi:hypothetical protein
MASPRANVSLWRRSLFGGENQTAILVINGLPREIPSLRTAREPLRHNIYQATTPLNAGSRATPPQPSEPTQALHYQEMDCLSKRETIRISRRAVKPPRGCQLLLPDETSEPITRAPPAATGARQKGRLRLMKSPSRLLLVRAPNARAYASPPFSSPSPAATAAFVGSGVGAMMSGSSANS